MTKYIDAPEHERQLAGLALLDPSVIVNASDVTPEQFTDNACRAVWTILCRLRDAGQLTRDIKVIAREAKLQSASTPKKSDSRTLFDEIGGNAGFLELTHNAGLSSSVPLHVSDIKREHALQRLRDFAASIRHLCEERDADPAAILQRVDAELHACVETAGRAELIAEVMANFIQTMDEGETRSGIPTGIPSFDVATGGGLHRGEMIVVAARPSIGKSALAAGMAIHAAEQGFRTLFVSLEMPSRDIVLRVMAGRSGESMKKLRSGEADRSRVEQVAGQFADVPLSLWSGRQVSIEQIHGICRLQQARGGLDVVFVDYIGLVRPMDGRKPRWEAVTETSNALKSMALSLDIPVVALCQLNRDAEGVEASLSDLRDSGAIEQDADVVALLNRPRDSSAAVLNVAKIRNGMTGPIDLKFNGAKFEFSEPATDSRTQALREPAFDAFSVEV